MRILVVEDMLDLHAEIAARLSKSGLTIEELLFAANRHDAGNEAIAHRPDLILYDLGLPDCTPEESVLSLRQFTNRFPVVILSGQKEGTYWRPCIEAGAMDYLSKTAYLATGSEAFLGHAIFTAWLRFHAK